MQNLLITWNEEQHQLGLPIIDEQHRGIVAAINSTYHILFMENNHEHLASLVELLHIESGLHFAVEEELMVKSNYPLAQTHSQLHRKLMERFHDVSTLDRILTNPIEFLDYLKTWWLDHINCDDREFAAFVCGNLQEA